MVSQGIFLENMERRVHGGLNVWRKEESWLVEDLGDHECVEMKAESHGGGA
jgi:hypothetical protein